MNVTLTIGQPATLFKGRPFFVGTRFNAGTAKQVRPSHIVVNQDTQLPGARDLAIDAFEGDSASIVAPEPPQRTIVGRYTLSRGNKTNRDMANPERLRDALASDREAMNTYRQDVRANRLRTRQLTQLRSDSEIQLQRIADLQLTVLHEIGGSTAAAGERSRPINNTPRAVERIRLFVPRAARRVVKKKTGWARKAKPARDVLLTNCLAAQSTSSGG